MSVLVLLILGEIALFVFVGIRAVMLGLERTTPPLTRRLSWALVAGCLAVVIGAIARVILRAANDDLLGEGAAEWALTVGQWLITLVAIGCAFLALWMQLHALRLINRGERILRVLINSPLVDVRVSELGLTAREVEILEAMAQGHSSDKEIADTFYITPSTAATHVRNIMRKADIHDRRDLILLYRATQELEAT